MKKITLFALILVAFVAVLWSCTKEEITENPNLSLDDLAQQLAKDEDFVKSSIGLHEIGEITGTLINSLSLAEKREFFIAHKKQDRVAMAHFAENFLNQDIIKQKYQSVNTATLAFYSKFPRLSKLSQPEKQALFAKSRSLLNRNARAENSEACFSAFMDCQNNATEWYQSMISNCSSFEKEQERISCYNEIQMQYQMYINSCKFNYQTCLAE